jgi:REP element-mobilizing transposase RayT
MPKKKFIRSSEFPYHVSARSNNREWFGLDPERLWSIFSSYLYLTQKLFNLEIHAFVMMSNHFHLIVKTPNANLDVAMRYFMRETSRAIGHDLGRINHVYGGPYHSSLIGDYNYYLRAYKYVLRNPVAANMCKKVEEYSFSTLHGLLGFKHLLIPVCGNDELFYNTENFLDWLNLTYEESENEVIRKALKRREFKPYASQKTRKRLVFDPFNSPYDSLQY